MNFHFCLYLQFPFSLQDKELLCYSSPYVGIATLGCFPGRKANFDSWHSAHTTNNLEAAELRTPLKPQERTRSDPCVHTAAHHSTFHSHSFSRSSSLTPPILCVSGGPASSWERQCCLLAKVWYPAVRDWGSSGGIPKVGNAQGTSLGLRTEGLNKFALGYNIFLLTVSELHNGEVKDMPVSPGRNWGSETKPFALEGIIPTTLDRMETNNEGWN